MKRITLAALILTVTLSAFAPIAQAGAPYLEGTHPIERDRSRNS